MIRRLGKNLGLYVGSPPEAAVALERDGYAVLPAVLSPTEVAELAAEIEAVFDAMPVDPRPRQDRAEFRYEMLNRSGRSQAAIGHPDILAAIEPLLGEDCHVIANTAWRNPPEFGGGPWHCDAGPHVPRPAEVPWDGRRDIAQRLRPTADCHQLSADAVARATTDRERALVGLHDPYFYDG
jgi:ectoine hydroxylase-related dioxygenase (phytanoyl-CoA dioxygenase family)